MMGLFFMTLPFIGGTFNGLKGAFLEQIVIGGALLAVGLLIVFSRRGTTIDRRDQVVSFWWGLPWAPWSNRRDLSRYTAVGIERRFDGDGIVGTIYLEGTDEPELVLHTSKDLKDVQILADQIGRFLDWPVNETAVEI